MTDMWVSHISFLLPSIKCHPHIWERPELARGCYESVTHDLGLLKEEPIAQGHKCRLLLEHLAK